MIYLYIGLGVLLLLILIILIKTFIFVDKTKYKIERSKEDRDIDNVSYKLGELIKFKTISNLDHSKVDYKIFQGFIDKLKELYPNCFKFCEFDQAEDYNIMLKLKGESSIHPTVLMAHYDVVPVTDGWEKDPFLGEVVDGYVYGRGAIDTKGTLVCIMSSLEKALKNNYKPKNDLYITFGSDEEVFGTSQVKRVEKFKKQGLKPYLVLDEGGGILRNAFPGVKEDAAFLGVVEKGMLNIQLSIDSNGGHSSTPKKNSPIIKLSKALIKLENNPMKPSFTPSSKELINIMGRHSSFGLKIIFANMWLFSGLLKKLFVSASADTRALLTSTFAFTTINGGNVTNVIPNHVEANINVRVAPFDTKEKVIEHIKKVLNDDSIKVKVVFNQKMYKECSFTSEAYNIVKDIIIETYENTIVAPFIMLGGTDGRHYNEISDCVIRFSPMKLTNTDRLGVHGINEKISVSSLEKCLDFYDRLLKAI